MNINTLRKLNSLSGFKSVLIILLFMIYLTDSTEEIDYFKSLF